MDLGRLKANGEGVRRIIEELKGMGEGEVVQGVLMFYVERVDGEEGEERVVNVRVHDRMLYTSPGEDPATGSANIAYVSLLLPLFSLRLKAHSLLSSSTRPSLCCSLGPVLLLTPSLNLPPSFTGTLNYTVSQGREMGCPSRLVGRVVSVKGEVKECWIGGGVVKVGEGWIRVPEEEEA